MTTLVSVFQSYKSSFYGLEWVGYLKDAKDMQADQLFD
jgi:hypothetical protein